MNSTMITYYENYSPVGDVLVLAICMVFVVLIHTAYINRTKNFLYLRDMIVLLFAAAICDMLYHIFMNSAGEIPNVMIYIPRILFHMGLFLNLWLYILYMKEPLHLDAKKDRLYLNLASAGLLVVLLYEILGTPLRIGFYIDEACVPHSGFQIFPFAYLFFVVLLMFMVFKYKDRVFRPIIVGISATVGISVLIMTIQQLYGQSSFTTATFLFPIYGLLYLVHANPYDLEIGTVNESAFEELIEHSYEQKEELSLMSLYLHDYESNGRKYPEEIQRVVRRLSALYFRGATLFQISGGHLILVINTGKNPDYRDKEEKLLAAFAEAYPNFRIDYKIVFTRTFNKISASNDYIAFIHFLHERMPENSFHRADDKDVKDYSEQKYIIQELADIHAKADLKDPRVEVYCQPVYNIQTGTYDTAEALMRLRLPEAGLVFPDRFISVAESHRYIHTLTRIILSKTCAQIKTLTDNGYNVLRISVNFSVFDVREPGFTQTVESIARENGVELSRIAVEITESQNEQDFEIIKEKVRELKDSGIKFYLDDFGTGYSNFERIMELPFDIIKFDRSLVIASQTDDKMRAMVSHMARMFADLDYGVLYEGVEDEDDESRCKAMNAKYLQGFKYSKPIPIERLTDYFEKKTG